MKGFETGVQDYLNVSVTMNIAFPIDRRGVARIACNYCPLFSVKRCVRTGEVIVDPEQYVGRFCPIKEETEGREDGI